MSWLFHTHDFEEIARTYAEPTSFKTVKGADGELMERLLQGSTTIILKCKDKSCGCMRTVVAVGKIIS